MGSFSVGYVLVQLACTGIFFRVFRWGGKGRLGSYGDLRNGSSAAQERCAYGSCTWFGK